MSIAGDVGPAQLGHRIAQLREQTGLKQAELARQVTWSQAVLSRIEAGERAVSDDELQTLLRAIGTDSATELAASLRRQWRDLPRPALDHPDQDLLWRANVLLAKLRTLAETTDISKPFEHRLTEYRKEIEQLASLLLRREHQLAFVGNIGVGKSTAICRATGLEVPGQNGRPSPVLETGAGRVTMCEVHLRVGPGYGIVVVPRSHEEVRADVDDFVDQLLRPNDAARDINDGEAASAVPGEIERAIRNMAELSPKRSKDAAGKTVRFDPARKLAESFPTHRELVVEVLTRMGLHRRDRREVRFEPGMAGDALEWLKTTFAEINNGRHPDFSLPARIDVIVPELMQIGDVKVSIVDTRGIDELTARADLEKHLEDPHTVAILCSGFPEAPATPVKHLLRRAREIRNEQIDTHCALLVLPRPEEAIAMKDESGLAVESALEGYELKSEQISSALTPFDMGAMPVDFFNAHEEDVDPLRDFLGTQVLRTRDEFRRRIADVLSNAERLLENWEQEQVRADQREAGKHVAAWVGNNPTPADLPGHVQDTLLTELERAHASSIHAAVRREGEWRSLSYSHQLGHGARKLAVASLRDAVVSFNGLCETLSTSLPDAAELLAQGSRVMSQAYEDLLRKLQVTGSTLHREQLQRDTNLWRDLTAEWGRGSGYRERVSAKNRSWFGETERQNLEQELRVTLAREWSELVARVSSIFETD
jgi:transcriptional regulator with XRE-family HTH domain